jgi:hypothetical protein
MWEKGQNPKDARPAKRAAPDLGEDVEWFEGDEIELLARESADAQAAAQAAPQWKLVDLAIPGAAGPETHTYRGMAIHIYAKQA